MPVLNVRTNKIKKEENKKRREKNTYKGEILEAPPRVLNHPICSNCQVAKAMAVIDMLTDGYVLYPLCTW